MATTQYESPSEKFDQINDQIRAHNMQKALKKMKTSECGPKQDDH